MQNWKLKTQKVLLPFSQWPADADCLFGFTGRPSDSATGLQNNLHRWYDSNTGRWISTDPIGFKGRDTNTYRYVTKSPTNSTDPTGLEDLLNILAVDATNWWTFEEFLDAIAKTKPGDVVRYYGHGTSDLNHLKFDAPGWFDWVNSEFHSAKEILKNWRGKASIFIIQACATKHIAGEMVKWSRENDGALYAVIGTNVAVEDKTAVSLGNWFLEGLHWDKTIEGAVDYANAKMNEVWKLKARYAGGETPLYNASTNMSRSPSRQNAPADTENCHRRRLEIRIKCTNAFRN